MVIFRHPWLAALPALSLLVLVPACGGVDTMDTASATATTGTTTDPTTGTTTGTSLDPTTGSTGDSPTGTTTGDPTTGGTTTGTTAVTTDPTTGGTTTGTTGDVSTTGDTTGDPDTTTTGTTGGVGPEHIPEIPDDGMPSSAHHTPKPLGTTEAENGYWEYLPPGYGEGELYPLLVFWHGIGENGNGDSDLNKVLNNGPPKLIKDNNWAVDRPFVVLSPQHPGDGCPGAGEIFDFIAYAAAAYDINPARIYLTGLSCGAIGSWNYLGQHLDAQIAAMVPIAGDGNGAFNNSGCDLGGVPLWAFHGDNDGTVDVNGTIGPITKLQMCDPVPDAEMTIYPGVGHNSWSMTYDLSAGHDIYAWMLERYKQ